VAPGAGPQGGAAGAGGGAAGFGHFGLNNAQHQPGHLQNQGMGYPMFAPHGQNPLAGWYPHMMGGLPGAIPPEGTQGGAGTGAGAGGTGIAGGGAAPIAQAHYIPNYSIPNVTHPIPGFIPLFPVGGAQERAGHNIWAPQGLASPFNGDSQSPFSDANSSSSSSSRTPNGHLTSDRIPLTTLDSLTEDQIKYLEENTRRGLQERLRVLQAVESQIAESVSVLSRVLGALPPVGTPIVPSPVAEAQTSSMADTGDFADPPSPISAFVNGASSPSSAASIANQPNGAAGSARNWMLGGAGLGSTTPIGLQSITRGGFERVLPSLDDSTQETAIEADTMTLESPLGVNGTGSNHVVSATSATTAASTTPSSDSGVPTSQPSQSTRPEATELGEQNGLSVRLIDKGKGKKTEAELEEEALREKAEQEDNMDNEDEDYKYSPQEMVRRRWARMDVSPSE
jgi:hypothetical protein